MDDGVDLLHGEFDDTWWRERDARRRRDEHDFADAVPAAPIRLALDDLHWSLQFQSLQIAVYILPERSHGRHLCDVDVLLEWKNGIARCGPSADNLWATHRRFGPVVWGRKANALRGCTAQPTRQEQQPECAGSAPGSHAQGRHIFRASVVQRRRRLSRAAPCHPRQARRHRVRGSVLAPIEQCAAAWRKEHILDFKAQIRRKLQTAAKMLFPSAEQPCLLQTQPPRRSAP